MAKKLTARHRRRGIQRGKPVWLTAADPEAPRLNPPLQRTPIEIRMLRESLGMTQREFARVLHVHASTPKKYESTSEKSSRSPSCACLRVMEIIERNHDVIPVCIDAHYFSSEALRELRKSFRVSQNIFASLLGVTKDSLCTWEQGTRQPSGPVAVLMSIALAYPNEIFPSFAKEAKLVSPARESSVTKKSGNEQVENALQMTLL